MPRYRPLFAAIRLAVACVVLAIGLRTWLVMGLIDPVSVAGSSMAPTLRGEHVTALCPDCQHTIDVGARFAATADHVTCPQCNGPKVPLGELLLQRGDRLWIDRTLLTRRQPRRWELVVTRNPANATELSVKRIVGLPGETIALQDGNVVIDGDVAVKPRPVRRAMQQLVHFESKASGLRWQPDDSAAWQYSNQSWLYQGQASDELLWLSYQHPNNQPLTDDVTYNAGLTRRLNVVDEFLLSCELTVQGEGTLGLRFDDGTTQAQLELRLPSGECLVSRQGEQLLVSQLSSSAVLQLRQDSVLLECTNFDGQLVLTLEGEQQFQLPWPQHPASGVTRPVAFGACGIELQISRLSLYRDFYHSTHVANSLPPKIATWQLGPGEYFLLGDNPPVSLDSRSWGPVPARLLIGKPIGSR